MIFSRIFKNLEFKNKKAKWQHKNSDIRLIAINEELNSTAQETLDILMELATNDVDELVRKAALDKLNTFSYWLSTCNKNANDNVRRYAQQNVVEILTGQHKINLTIEQKNSLVVDGSVSLNILELWLQQETSADLIISLYQKVNKPHLITALFTQKKNSQVQHYFIEQIEDVALLEKLAKKVVNADVAKALSSKITTLIEQAEKPKKLVKAIQLVLSKLLALKELTDYATFLTKKAALEQEWQMLLQDVSLIADTESQVFIAKHQDINTQLTKIFAVKEEAYQQQQITEKLLADKHAAKHRFEKALADIHQALTNSIFDNTFDDIVESTVLESTLPGSITSENVGSESTDEKSNSNELSLTQQFIQQLAQLKADVLASVLNDQEQTHYTRLITAQIQRVNQSPEIAKSVSEATYLISSISQLALPSTLADLNEKEQTFTEWLQQWRLIEKQAQGILPLSIVNAYKEIKALWTKGLQPLQKEQKALFTQTKKALADLKRLLAMGKYNVCFGIFKRIKPDFGVLSVKQQQQLKRDFDAVSEKMAELSDWEHYIATPRKQELLDTVNALISTPLDNLNEQAANVKQYRKVWNSLGHADDEVDAALNKAFNEACEQAFTPCRLYFGEQEKLREQHLQTRLAIIEQAKALQLLVTEDALTA